MALVAELLVSSFVTVTFNSYNGTPETLAHGEVELATVRPPLMRNRESEQVFSNSSSGKIVIANPFIGVAGGQTYTLTFHLLDPKNNTDATVAVSLYRAMAKNSVAGTGFSAWVLTNQYVNGGMLMGKHLFTQRSTGGTSNVVTVPHSVVSVEPGALGAHESMVVTFRVEGEPTVA